MQLNDYNTHRNSCNNLLLAFLEERDIQVIIQHPESSILIKEYSRHDCGPNSMVLPRYTKSGFRRKFHVDLECEIQVKLWRQG